jgi:hypothetical protein
MSDMRAEAIGSLANEAKNVSDGKIMVISFYGYNMRVMDQILQVEKRGSVLHV